MLKKVILTFFVFCCFCITPVYSEGTVLQVSSVTASAGDTVDITVSITGNPGIAAFNLVLVFDSSIVTPVSIEKNVATGTFASNLESAGGEELDSITAVWVDNADYTEDGALLSVKFKIKDEAQGNIKISVTGKMCNYDGDDIDASIVNGGINIGKIETTGSTPKPTSSPSDGNSSVSVIMDGKPVNFDVLPVMENDRVLVPFRAIFEQFGATVEWDEETQTVTAKTADKTVILQIDNCGMYINGEMILLDV
ncbi:MAG: stalk domain-containing protein, partial [Oscillospiraceae bacterium]|nr:stalk domain-containing protein [Oscillospiraceae bacterium]